MNEMPLQMPSLPEENLPQPGRPRWELLRAGIQNIWEYDDQRFVFHRGRLLLRGRNEVGKSKALEVLLPFLLDADLSPQRLDPFGSTSRQMRWNLLSDRYAHREIGLGYVWVELGRSSEAEPEYLTLGAGLKARRSDTRVESWFFITSRRVDLDLHPLDEQRRPLERRRLEEVLGDQGAVFDRKLEYRAEVNRRLFGLGTEQYDALIETLIQLRKPQLSKQLNPEQLSKILTAGLPPLNRDVVGRLGEGFARLDRHRAQRDEWERVLHAVEGFRQVYRRYARLHVAARALAMTRADSEYQKARAAVREREQELESVKKAVADQITEIDRLEEEERRLRTRLDALRSSEEYRTVERLIQAEKDEHDRSEEEQRTRGDLEKERQERQHAAAARDEAASRLANCERQERKCAAAAESAAQEAALAGIHRSIAALLEGDDVAAARGALESLLQARRGAIAKVEALQQEVRAAQEKVGRAQERLAETKEAVRAARERLADLEKAGQAAEAVFADDVAKWIDEASALSFSEEEAQGLLESDLGEMQAGAHAVAQSRRGALDESIASQMVSIQRIDEQIEKTAAERDTLESQSHQPPEAPLWRADRGGRPGAPLYLLCEPGDGFDGETWARLEAGLQASGLLDAWVMPDGSVLDAATFDLLILPQASAGGPTLADVMRPVAVGGVNEETAAAVLRSISLVEAGDGPEAGCWVSTDGRFGLGPLRGAWRKQTVEHLGAVAREQARLRRLDALSALLAELMSERQALAAELEFRQLQRAQIELELERFPPLDAVIQARARVEAGTVELNAHRQNAEAAEKMLETERGRLEQTTVRRDEVANREGLAAWVADLTELRERTTRYGELTSQLITQSTLRLEIAKQLRAGEDNLTRMDHRLERAETRWRQAGEAAREAGERARTLRASAGATRHQIVQAVREAENSKSDVARRLRQGRDRQRTLDQRLGTAESDLGRAAQEVVRREELRESNASAFRALSAAGLIHEAEIDLAREQPPPDWSLTDTLLTARSVQAETDITEVAQDALDRAEDGVVRRHTELTRQLTGNVRLSPGKQDGLLLYEASLQGRQSRLRDLAGSLTEEVAARDRLLDAEEREVFESFLSGETHEHLRSRLREAQSLVDGINSQLRDRPTPGGMLLRLAWKPDENAPPGTNQAIDLLLRSAALLSGADREALATFLRRRLEEARAGEAEAPGSGLSERMLEVLDYRSWFGFVVEYKIPESGWKPLTKKVHGAGSGGQKAVMLHLPLFAAATAFYASARSGAPRIVLLDEAFAGIDRKMRSSLMGLLVAFDLDFIMTSYEEWGFYAELDGISTYNLVRDPAMPGVLCERFVWDGHCNREVAS